MIFYLLRRLAGAVVLLLIVTMAVFAIFFLIPRLGGATSDQLAARYVGKSPSPEAISQVKHSLGLDRSVPEQYGKFVKGMVVGKDYDTGVRKVHCAPPCLGFSFRNNLEVWPRLQDRIPVTLSLAAGAAVIWLVVGVSIGVVSALKRGTLWDRFSMGFALAGVSLPPFFTGLVALALFSYQWPIFKGVHYVPFFDNPGSWAWNLVLPWLTLAFLYAALYARLTRAGMLETMSEDYIRTARAKGLRERDVIVKHGLRAALTPILTIFGMDVGLLLGGAILTEQVYSLDGIGKFAVEAITQQDLPEVLGVTMIAAIFVILANLVVDLLYAVVDPRVRT
ncbi:ABC transporter permease [Embleya sp. NPDC001921]